VLIALGAPEPTHAGTEAFAQLIDKLPPDEAAALAADIPALQHLRDLDNEEREPASRTPARSASKSSPPNTR
jgi:hypothetical protein